MTDTPTCPRRPWCKDDHRDGDPYTLDEHISHDVAEIALTRPFQQAPRLFVYVVTDEYGPRVNVDLDEADGLHLTAAEARALAAALVGAAELLEAEI